VNETGMIKTDAVDDGIMAILREDGRLSNREVARRLDVSEGTVRQRLKKLQDAGAIRIGVVTDANRTGVAVSAWVRIAVAPEHADSALRTFAGLDEALYVAAIAGRFNVMIVLGAANQLELMRVINTKIESSRGVAEVDVRIIAQTVKHDIHEVVVRPSPESRKPSPKQRRTRRRGD
jgi:DNA-binding Lrp family transcriptional regulator